METSQSTLKTQMRKQLELSIGVQKETTEK